MEEKLVDLIEAKAFLYDKKHHLYRNTKLKEKVWADISKELGIEGKYDCLYIWSIFFTIQ